MLSRRQIEYGEELQARAAREVAEMDERIKGLEEQLAARRADRERLLERADLLEMVVKPVVEDAARLRGMEAGADGEAEK